MEFSDAEAVERFVQDLCHEYGIGGLPVRLSTEYDRVEVDLTYCRLRAGLVQDWLAQRMGRLGYIWDFWFPDREPHRTLCVSEKEVEE